MEKESMKKEIILELILDKLYRCLVVENKKVTFDKYNLDKEDMQFLLRKYDKETYDAYCEMLLDKKD